ncbi:hypothetical protein EK21DRAFT_110274 [Setomelanomma holmii]|uniref:Uncharacterized protein n=1 Tax=Setomelanomma holmii TaxID=210430 RepID=A0A9P4HFG5_9PLEO|nr:hypothetical protein EK21DRAFT_110274 [Setomelanomma holmii]
MSPPSTPVLQPARNDDLNSLSNELILLILEHLLEDQQYLIATETRCAYNGGGFRGAGPPYAKPGSDIAALAKLASTCTRNRDIKWQLKRLRPLAFCALILSQLPNLKNLDLASQLDNGSSDALISRIFFTSSGLSDDEHDDALRELARCPGLAHLQHMRLFSIAPLFSAPLDRVISLRSLDISLKDVWTAKPTLALDRIMSLRLDCDQATRFQDMDYLHRAVERILSCFRNLEILHFYDSIEVGQSADMSSRERYSELAISMAPVKGTLRKLELPCGCWTMATSGPNQITSEQQPGAMTGSIANLSSFEKLEDLVIHSTAIIAKGLHDTQVADPTSTLSPTVKDITVYGPHDGLWSWIGDILDHRGSHFHYLRFIRLLREKPVLGLKLSSRTELKESHEKLWEMVTNSTLKFRGDIYT